MPASPTPPEPHRIARVNYPPRALSFIGAFGAVLLLALEHEFGTGLLLFAVFTFLVYPHLAFLHATRAANSKRAELLNLLIDSILLGVWVALAGFNLWLAFALLSATLINNAVVGGPRQLGLAAASFLIGSGAVVLVAGIDFRPWAGLGVTLYIAVLALGYLLAVGITANILNDRLAKAHQDLIRNSQVFRSLLRFTTVSNKAADVADLIDQALDHFPTPRARTARSRCCCSSEIGRGNCAAAAFADIDAADHDVSSRPGCRAQCISASRDRALTIKLVRWLMCWPYP
jgi:hypothetical protein